MPWPDPGALRVPLPRSPSSPLGLRIEQQLQTRGYELLDARSAAKGSTFEVCAGRWHAFDTTKHGALNVLVPVAMKVSVDAGGEVTALKGGQPSADDLAAAAASLADVIAAGRLDDPARNLRAAHATHEVVAQADGKRSVRRRGFDASPALGAAARR